MKNQEKPVRFSIDQIKQLPVWICWNQEPDSKGKMTKRPKVPVPKLDKAQRKYVLYGAAAQNDPKNWRDFQTAKDAAEKCGVSGVAICTNGELALIDLDDHDGNGLTDQAKDILKAFQGRTYIEKSPSGRGFHIIAAIHPDKLPKDYVNAANGCEIYTRRASRFFTWTGAAWTDNRDTETGSVIDFVSDQTATVAQIIGKYFRKAQTAPQRATEASPETQKSRYQWLTGELKKRNISYIDKGTSRDGAMILKVTCPWSEDHTTGESSTDSVLMIQTGGGIVYKCHHQNCRAAQWEAAEPGRAWKEFKQHFSIETGKAAPEKEKPKGRPRKPRLTIQELAEYLSSLDLHIRRNVISHQIEYTGAGTQRFNLETLLNEVPIWIRNNLADQYTGVTSQTVSENLFAIAAAHPYNPVQNLLDNAPAWDGRDYLSDLIRNVMQLPESDALSKTLIRKFLQQAIVLATRNTPEKPFGSDGILVLSGEQGAGKSLLAARLAVDPSLSKTGLHISFQDKDTLIRATSAWISEFAEIGSIFRRDIDSMKAFLTSEVDQIRAPYARTDDRYVRRTSFIATVNAVNDTKFLLDPTGNRRYWTIPLTGYMDPDAIINFPYLQLWKQIEADVIQAEQSGNLQFFRLTREEQTQLANRNGFYVKPVKAQEEVEDILAEINAANMKFHNYETRFATVAQFKGEHMELSRYSVGEVGKALTALGIDAKPVRIDGKSVRGRLLPMRKDGTNLFRQKPSEEDNPFEAK